MFNCINPYFNRQNPFLGSGLINTPAPVGYGVTNMPLFLPTFFGLGDRYWTSNFGNETQHNIYQNGYDPLVYHLAHHPELMYTDPLLTQFTGDMGMGQIAAMQQVGTQRIVTEHITNRINDFVPASAQTLAALKANLEALINNDQLTDDEKNKVKAKLAEVEALAKKIEKALEGGMAPTVANLKKIEDFEDEIRALKVSISELATAIAAQHPATTPEETPSTPGETPAAPGSEDETPSEDVDSETGRPTVLGDAPSKADCQKICNKIDKALNWGPFGIGTDNASLAAALNTDIDPTNIIEVIDYWDKFKDGNFFEKIFDDIDDKDQTIYIDNAPEGRVSILDSLIARAEANGIYNEIEDDVCKVREDLNARKYGMNWQNDEQLAADLMAIVNKIKKHEAANKTDKSKKTDKTENTTTVDVTAKKAETEANKKAEFLRRLKMKLGKKDEDIQLVDSLKVITNDKGDFEKYQVTLEGCVITANSFDDLIKAMEEYEFTAQDLIKKPLSAAA